MLYSLPNRKLIGASIAAALYFTLYRVYLYSPGEVGGIVNLTPAHRAACQPCPGCDSSSASRLIYDTAVPDERPIVGDAASIGNPDQCLVASSRLDQYEASPGRDWSRVRWGEVQKRCATAGNYKAEANDLITYNTTWFQKPETIDPVPTPAPLDLGKRTAIILRTWDNYNYTASRKAWLRALIAETALHSGGEFQVFLLVNVKDNANRLDQDAASYEETLRATVPVEFRDMALLYSERVLETWFPQIPNHGAQDQMYQALQIFAHKFPQFAHVWQLEMDLRLTGHVLATLQSATRFARAQPRRNLWERNGRFFVPQLHDGGSWESFAREVDEDVGEDGVWGPERTAGFEPKGPEAPARSERDWGVGEDPDLVSLMPMIDPVGTDWVYEHEFDGFEDGEKTPRRAAFISVTRSSRRLLLLIGEAQRAEGRWLVSEATLETFSLLHGLKAVTVPHPIAFSNGLNASIVDAEINRGPPHNKAGGSLPSIAYSFHGWIQGPWFRSSYWFASNDASELWQSYLGGRCLPPMFLHPVKDE
ncbi:hypothetical protein GGR54DRAFT_331012 [Hypoxylon sp. NC1633]|nr:hypothetical protein GGR54DRAFT_331012 [Hypoxylon sp. NC1633]